MLSNYTTGVGIWLWVQFESGDPDTVTVGIYYDDGSNPPKSGTSPKESYTFTRGVKEVEKVVRISLIEGEYYLYYTLDNGKTWVKLGTFRMVAQSTQVLAQGCSNGIATAIVAYGGKIYIGHELSNMINIPSGATHAVVEVWCSDTGKVYVDMLTGPFQPFSTIYVTPDLTPPISFSFDIVFSGDVPDDYVNTLNYYLSSFASGVFVYKSSSNTVTVAVSKSGPGLPTIVVAIIVLVAGFIAGYVAGNIGVAVNAFSNFKRQEEVGRYLNETLPKIVNTYNQLIGQCMQLSDTQSRLNCIDKVSKVYEAMIRAAAGIIHDSQPPPQQPSISQWLSQNWWIVALALLVLLLLRR